MQISFSRFSTITLGIDYGLPDLRHLPPDYLRILPLACPRPMRRTLAQLHRDLFRSRYSGADLRRLAGDPNRRECRRRRRVGGLAARSSDHPEA